MIEYIQILRFAAAIWVTVFHGAMAGIFPSMAPWMDSFINLGYAGVDVFFVISGVIMAHTTKNVPHGPRAAGAFFLIRFARIYTGWWPAMLLYVILFKITHQLNANINLYESFFLYFTDLSGLINIAIWSLMFELYFYIIVSVGILFPKPHRDVFIKILFASLILINFYLLIIRSAANTDSETNWIQMFYIAPIVAEFFAGYFIYSFMKDSSRSSWKTIVVLGILAATFIVLIAYTAPHFSDRPYGLANSYYWPERAVLVGGAALAIVGIAIKLPSPRNHIALALIKFGDYSYAIYLLHILAFNMLLNLLPWGSFDNNQRIIYAFSTLMVLLLASATYYHWIEHPIYMFFRRNIRRKLSSTRE